MGIKTGIDFNLLLECVKIAEKFAGEPLPGHLLRANPNFSKTKVSENLKPPMHLDV
jgi:hypothetical protein